MSNATKENIKRLLDLTGTTHAQLAEIAGVHRTAVTHWCSGKSEPKRDNMERIAKRFGLAVENLSEPGGMAYVHRTPDGRLRDDGEARVRDLAGLVLEYDGRSPVAYRTAVRLDAAWRPVTNDERDLVGMFRSMDEDGRSLSLATLALFAERFAAAT